MMLKKEDEEWLAESHPRLTRTGSRVEGTITFRATHNADTGLFLIVSDDVCDTVGGLSLCGTFEISIEERSDKAISKLPALRVEGIEAVSDRHFSQLDKSACLSSPFEETDFLVPDLDFRGYIERLVIPFLYGQIFYSQHERWPWSDYAHGAVGLLESYSRCPENVDPTECLRLLMMDSNWPKVRAALLQESIKGHTQCFCAKGDNIRRCHPAAMRGVQQLQRELRAMKAMNLVFHGRLDKGPPEPSRGFLTRT